MFRLQPCFPRRALGRVSAALAFQTNGLGSVILGKAMVDGDFQVGDALEDAAADAFAGDPGEEALDEIEPRRRGGREMQTEPGMQRRPLLDLRMLMSGVVVYD